MRSSNKPSSCEIRQQTSLRSGWSSACRSTRCNTARTSWPLSRQRPGRGWMNRFVLTSPSYPCQSRTSRDNNTCSLRLWPTRSGSGSVGRWLCVHRIAAFSSLPKDQSQLRLALDAHATLAFAAGSVVNIKSGRQVELEREARACGSGRPTAARFQDEIFSDLRKYRFAKFPYAPRDVVGQADRYRELGAVRSDLDGFGDEDGPSRIGDRVVVPARNRSRAGATLSSSPTRRRTRSDSPIPTETTSPSSRRRTPSPSFLASVRTRSAGSASTSSTSTAAAPIPPR